jgi:predicted cupin superfamily sugar epimerase
MQKDVFPEIAELIKKLDLKPHCEGGFFKEIYRSNDRVYSDSKSPTNESRRACTSIYYLLAGSDFSAWHRLNSDEILNYHMGNSLAVYSITQTGGFRQEILGNPLQDENAKLQVILPAKTWFAAELIEEASYSLLGCTVSPGFEFQDFELANRSDLLSKYPQYSNLITKLTR